MVLPQAAALRVRVRGGFHLIQHRTWRFRTGTRGLGRDCPCACSRLRLTRVCSVNAELHAAGRTTERAMRSSATVLPPSVTGCHTPAHTWALLGCATTTSTGTGPRGSPTASGRKQHSADQRANDRKRLPGAGRASHPHRTHGRAGAGGGQAPSPTRSRHGRQEGRARRVTPAQGRDLTHAGSSWRPPWQEVSPDPHSAVSRGHRTGLP